MKKTVIVGATPNPNRYAYRAAQMLTGYNHPIELLGIRKGLVMGHEIKNIRNKPDITDVDTLTLYINPWRQQEWYDYLLGLQPGRIIFNPGTENSTFAQMAKKRNIEPVFACTLVMLSTETY